MYKWETDSTFPQISLSQTFNELKKIVLTLRIAGQL